MANRKTKSTKNLIEFAMHKTFSKKQQIECNKRQLIAEAYTNYNANLNNDITVVFIGYVKAKQGYIYSFKDYPFYRITYTTSGQAKLKTSKGTFPLKNGAVCGFPPKDSSTISVDTNIPWGHYFLHFTGKKASKLFNQTKLNAKKVIYSSNPPEISEYFKKMISEERKSTDLSHIINVYQLRILLLKLVEEAHTNSDVHSLASRESYLRCRRYINQNFPNITSLQKVCEECGISEVYLCRLFRKYADTSPLSYINNLKINKAAIQLLQTDFSIKQVSYSLGFDDPYYFSKVFKKKYGISPKYYRKKEMGKL